MTRSVKMFMIKLKINALHIKNIYCVSVHRK